MRETANLDRGVFHFSTIKPLDANLLKRIIKNSYMPPHKHPTRNSESYHVISGKLDLYNPNKKGDIIEKISLESYKKNPNKKFYYRTNSRNFWHMLVVQSKERIYQEIYSGP